MIALEGYPFETADTETLNQIASTRDIIFRGIASSQLILYCHVVRRRVVADLALPQPEGLARQIDLQWRQQLGERNLFVNDIVLTLVRRPAKGKVGWLERLSRKMRGLQETFG